MAKQFFGIVQFCLVQYGDDHRLSFGILFVVNHHVDHLKQPFVRA